MVCQSSFFSRSGLFEQLKMAVQYLKARPLSLIIVGYG